jgi:ribosomal protein L16 Arg81 hydroxylase
LNENYVWPKQTWVSDVNCFPPSIIKKITKKYLCHISDSSRVNEKINTVCGELESITKLPTDAHIYFDLTDNLNDSFGIHFDMAHNLIVQIEGKSKIRMWNVKEYDENFRIIKNLEREPLFEIVMEPGDVFYAPAHYYHEVKSLTKRLSISFPSHPMMTGPFQEREWIKIT